MHPYAQREQYSKPLKSGGLRPDDTKRQEKPFHFLGKLYGLWDRYYGVLVEALDVAN
jgi:hypothetical protein